MTHNGHHSSNTHDDKDKEHADAMLRLIRSAEGAHPEEDADDRRARSEAMARAIC